MKNLVTTVILVGLLAFVLVGCGKTTNSVKTSDQASEDTTELSSDNRTGDSIKEDINSAASTKVGDKDKISGTYKVKIAGNDIKDTVYVFEDGKWKTYK